MSSFYEVNNMAFNVNSGVWPTMITAFTSDGKLDFKGISKMCDWYVSHGCDGVFTVCQSSEMRFLSEAEKLDLAKCVVDSIGGRIQVVASGHTQSDKGAQYAAIESMMKTGVDAYVLVSNRLDPYNEGDDVFEQNAVDIFERYPDIAFGIYECPHPYKRLVPTAFLSKYAKSGELIFLKDTCCDYELIRERLRATSDTGLKLFNANAATFYDSIVHGGAGYNGIMANFHPELYKWVITHLQSRPEEAKLLADFLTEAAMIELRAYPVSAKYHMILEGIQIELESRSADQAAFNRNARMEVDSLYALERKIRQMLDIVI